MKKKKGCIRIDTTCDNAAWNFASASLHSDLLGKAGDSTVFGTSFLFPPFCCFGAGLTLAGAGTGSSSLANKSTSSSSFFDASSWDCREISCYKMMQLLSQPITI